MKLFDDQSPRKYGTGPGIELATPGSAVRLASVARHVTDCATRPGTLSECRTIWIQIRTDTLSVLIWVQTVCKVYQQMAEVPASKERAKKKQ